jgi:hypothetical protein
MPESAAPIKCDSAAVADDFDAALSLVNSECQVRQLPTAPRVESRALPLLFFSFCIEFCNDYFIQPWDAAQLHSGDDKFLTRYITRRGWLMYTQTGDAAAVETTFKPNWRFLLQYMRWTRNTWRSDFRSLAKERAVWKSPHYWFLVFLMIDKCIAPFTLLFGPVLIFNVAMHSSLGLHATPDDADRPYRLPLWNVIASYVVWICLTRAFRIFPHFFRKPIHLLAIPFHVALQYLLAVLKIYCLFTLHVTDWGEKTHTHTHMDTRSSHGIARRHLHLARLQYAAPLPYACAAVCSLDALVYLSLCSPARYHCASGTRAVDGQDPPRPAPVKPQKADPPVPASMV